MNSLVDYLKHHIPLVRSIDIQAGQKTGQWFDLTAPLSPNINDKQTAFGGSLATLCTLSGWCVTAWLCREAGLKVDIAVIDSQIKYRLPTTTQTIVARGYFPRMQDQTLFIKRLEEHSTAKLSLNVEIRAGKKTSVNFSGVYYARLL